MSQVFVNNGVSTLAANVAAADTTIFIQAGHVARFPTIAAPDYCYVTLENAAGALEIVKVTAHAAASPTLAVVRAQQGTTALDWLSGDLVELRLTKEELNRFERAALRDGDAYSNVHDFTGATLKVKTPTTPSEAATKAFVEAFLAAATAAGAAGQLPNQAGKKGFLKTNGTIADWASPGSGGSTVTGNIALTVLSDAVMNLMPTTYGFYATLPDATTLDEGLLQYAFYNQSVFPYGIKNFAGVTLGWVPPHSGATLMLADNATAAGVWGGIGLSKIAISSELRPANQSTNYGDIARRVTLDANREFLFFISGSWSYGCVYDASDNSYGAMTTLSPYFPYAANCDVTLIEPDLLLLVGNTGANPIQVKAMTISVSGKSITPNAGGLQTYTGTYSSGEQSRTLAIGSTHVTGWVEGASERYVMGITVSGTTPSFGLPRALGTAGTTSPILLTTAGMLRALTSSAGFVSVTPYTVSGNALAVGTAASQATNSYNISRAYVNGNGNIFAQHHDGVAVFKLTGTTENVSNYGGFLSTQNLNFSCITPISTNKVLVAIRSSADVYVYLVTDTNGTASGNYTGWSFGGSAFSNITSLNVDGTVADVNGYFDASIFVSNSTEVRSINVKCAGGTLVLNKVNYQAIAASVAYPSQGQDTFGLPEAGQLRTLSRDIWTRAGYVASLQMSNHEANYLYGISENIAVRGKTNSIGWASKRTFQNDGLVLRKIEVCE